VNIRQLAGQDHLGDLGESILRDELPNVGLEAASLNRVGNNPRKIGVIVVNSRI
jgi:hypothetical protein